MHGAAQTANAPPSSTRRAATAGALEQPGADQPLGPRQQPHEGEAEDDEHEAGDLLEEELVVDERAADERGGGAEQDEHGGEAGDERDARRDHPPRRPRLAEPVGLDRRDGREVAGNEREHARGEEGEEPGDERDGELVRFMHRSGRARRRRAAPAPDRAAASRPGASGTGSRRRLQAQASAPTPTSADAQARRAEAPRRAGRSPRFGGVARTAGPNWSTSSLLISAALAPAAIRARMYAFIRDATGALDWSSVVWQVGQTSSASRSAGFGRSAAAAAGTANASTSASDGDEPHHPSASSTQRRNRTRFVARVDAARRSAPRRGARAGRRRRSRETRSRPSGRASIPCRRGRPDTDSPCLRMKRPRVALEVLCVDPEHDEAFVAMVAPGLSPERAPRPCTGCTTTPRS